MTGGGNGIMQEFTCLRNSWEEYELSSIEFSQRQLWEVPTDLKGKEFPT